MLPDQGFWKEEYLCKLPEAYISAHQFWDEPPVNWNKAKIIILFHLKIIHLKINVFLFPKSTAGGGIFLKKQNMLYVGSF